MNNEQAPEINVTVEDAQDALDRYNRGTRKRSLLRMVLLGMRVNEITAVVEDTDYRELRALVDEAFRHVDGNVTPSQLRKLFGTTLAGDMDLEDAAFYLDHQTTETTELFKDNGSDT